MTPRKRKNPHNAPQRLLQSHERGAIPTHQQQRLPVAFQNVIIWTLLSLCSCTMFKDAIPRPYLSSTWQGSHLMGRFWGQDLGGLPPGQSPALVRTHGRKGCREVGSAEAPPPEVWLLGQLGCWASWAAGGTARGSLALQGRPRGYIHSPSL